MIGIVVLHVDNTLQRKLTFRLSWTYMISSNIALAKSWLLLFLKNLLERRKDDDAWRRNMTGSPAELGSCWKGLTLWENILNQMVKENMMGQFFKKKNISHSSIFTSKYGACAYIPKQTLLDIRISRKKERTTSGFTCDSFANQNVQDLLIKTLCFDRSPLFSNEFGQKSLFL